MSIAAHRPEYDAMAGSWDLVHDLLGGTRAMREAGSKWLPREDSEGRKAFDVRLSRSILFGMLKDTIAKVTARPFAKPLTIRAEEEVRSNDSLWFLSEMLDDADGEGNDLGLVARDIFRIAATYGIVHVLVDYPDTSDIEDRAAEESERPRPVIIPVSPVNLIYWDSEVGPNGRTELTEIRIEDWYYRASDNARIQRVKVWKRDAWELHERIEGSDEWTVTTGEHTFGSIPLITGYFNRSGFMTAEPPFEDLAWLNVAHWQSYSDQRNILRFARTGVWFLRGVSPRDLDENPLVIGANSVYAAPSGEATLEVVEHSGAAIEQGRKDLEDLEQRAEVLGLQPFVMRSGGQTATGKAIDESRSQTDAMAWARATENILEECIHAALKWKGLEPEALPDGFGVDVFSDYGLAGERLQAAQLILQASLAHRIDRRTMLEEFKRLNVLSDLVDIDDVIERSEADTESEDRAILERMRTPFVG